VLPRLKPDHKARVVQFLYESGLIATGSPILDLRGANLSGADLSGADLSGADLGAVRLIEADLTLTDLREADLHGAELSGAKGWTEEQLAEAETLEFATMPDGQTLDLLYSSEKWLRSKGRGEAGENSGP
jgi:hypothetical protein